MTDTNAGRDDSEAVECLRAPFQELISRTIAFKLHRHVLFKRIFGAREINLNRMVYHEIHRASGSITAGFFPSRLTAERMAARSTSSGTPVKS